MAEMRPAQGMHRELKVVDAAAFSVGLIGPVGAIALLGTGAAGIIGRGVTHVASPFSYFGWIPLAWLVIGGAVITLAPGLAGRVRAGLVMSSA